MRWTVITILILLASSAQAYTGCCFLDFFLKTFDSIASTIGNIFNPTTTTTTTYSTTTTMNETTTSTTTTVSYTTTTSTTVSTTTTTTLSTGECSSKEDCPQDEEYYTCNFDGNVVRNTHFFYCTNPGLPESRCKSRQRQIIYEFCQQNQLCAEGTDHCIDE
jgi:hypothetical protein